MRGLAATLEYEPTDDQLKLESVKFGFHHMTDLLNDLEGGEHAEALALADALLAGDDVERRYRSQV